VSYGILLVLLVLYYLVYCSINSCINDILHHSEKIAKKGWHLHNYNLMNNDRMNLKLLQ